MAVTIAPTTDAGKERLSNAAWVQAKADAALAEIVTDLAQLDTDEAALPGADNATTKLILGRLMEMVERDLKRQRQIIKYVAARVT